MSADVQIIWGSWRQSLNLVAGVSRSGPAAAYGDWRRRALSDWNLAANGGQACAKNDQNGATSIQALHYTTADMTGHTCSTGTAQDSTGAERRMQSADHHDGSMPGVFGMCRGRWREKDRPHPLQAGRWWVGRAKAGWVQSPDLLALPSNLGTLQMITFKLQRCYVPKSVSAPDERQTMNVAFCRATSALASCTWLTSLTTKKLSSWWGGVRGLDIKVVGGTARPSPSIVPSHRLTVSAPAFISLLWC